MKCANNTILMKVCYFFLLMDAKVSLIHSAQPSGACLLLINKLVDLTKILNFFLAACYEVFDKVDSLSYKNTKKTVLYLSIFKSQLENNLKTNIRHRIIKSYLMLNYRLSIIYRSVFSKEYRSYLFKKIIYKIRR